MEAKEDIAPEGTTQDFVAIEEASDLDIEAFLNTPEPEAEEVSEEGEPEEHPETEEAQAEEAPEEAAGEPSAADKVTLTREQWEQLQSELEKRQQMHVANQEMIRRQADELGQRRKQLKDALARLGQDLEDLAHSNPLQAMERKEQIKELKEELQDLDHSEVRLSRVQQTQSLFKHHKLDDGSITPQDPEEVFVADGASQEELQAIRQDPYSFFEPVALLQAAKRARERKVAKQLYSHAKGLDQKVKQLEAELKKLKAGPQSILEKVQKTASQPPRLSAAGGAPKSRKVASIEDTSQLTDAQIAELLASPG